MNCWCCPLCAKWVMVGSFCCGLVYETLDQPAVEPTQTHVHNELNTEPIYTISSTVATTTTPPPMNYYNDA